MPPVIFEAADSGNDLTYGSQGGGVTLRWIVTGTDSKEDAYSLGLVTSPDAHLGFVRENIAPEWLGGPTWKVNVRYGVLGLGGGGVPVGSVPPEPTAPGGGGGASQTTPLTNGYSFDTTGRTVRIINSISTTSVSVPSGEDNLNFQNLINVAEGKAEGVDIPAPALRWSRTVARASLTMGYVRTLKNATGKTNDAEFYGFPEGTLTYLGGTGQFIEGEGWTITHHFEHEEDKGSFTVGDINVPGKKGTEYLWVYYKESWDAVANERVLAPRQANVEKVLDSWNFLTLEIGA
jgi:hypothetical protein